MSNKKIERACGLIKVTVCIVTMGGAICNCSCGGYGSRSLSNTLGMQFVALKSPGSFGPQKVFISAYETRVRDYSCFARDAGRKFTPEVFRGVANRTHVQTENEPVVNVSWEDAKRFCDWLTEREQKAGKLRVRDQYRLPTDQEWSRAAGIGALEMIFGTPAEKSGKIMGRYPWGAEIKEGRRPGNYAGIERSEITEMFNPSHWDKYIWTAPVGQFHPTCNGLYDLGGNVWEWCADEYYPGNDLLRKVCRGGSYLGVEDPSSDSELSSYRLAKNPSGCEDVGFRVVLEIHCNGSGP